MLWILAVMLAALLIMGLLSGHRFGSLIRVSCSWSGASGMGMTGRYRRSGSRTFGRTSLYGLRRPRVYSKKRGRVCSTQAAAYKNMDADQDCQSCPEGAPVWALNHSLKP